MKKINVLVTGAGGMGHGSSIVRALMLSNLSLNIVVADMNPRLLNASPVKNKEIIPSASSKEYIPKIIEILKKYEIHCLFTGSEQELVKMIDNKKEIEKYAKLFMNSESVVELCKNKFLCNTKLEELGFYPPKSLIIKNEDDKKNIDFLPVVLKPNFDSGASANIYVAKTKNELDFMVGYLISIGVEIIAQEYMEFSNNEYTVGVDSDLISGEIFGSIVMEKFLEGGSRLPTGKDIVISSGMSQGAFDDFQYIKKQCEDIARGINSKGPLNIQCRVIDGKVKPFEINPRFSGATSARAFTGYNQPEFYIRKYILNDEDAISSLNMSQKGYIVKGLDERFIV